MVYLCTIGDGRVVDGAGTVVSAGSTGARGDGVALAGEEGL